MTRLPSKWTDALFGKMALRYGQQWAAKWAGLPMDAVKDDWAAELGCFADKPAFIAYGLENLPAEFPPTVAQFKAICINRPSDPAPMLIDGPKADPERVAAIVGTLRSQQQSEGPRAWAYRLQALEKGGARLSPFQRFCWREALRTVDAVDVVNKFVGVNPADLPPGMMAA
jgi:hypothetical protein